MKNILFSKISKENIELYEQVFSLVNSILLAKKTNKTVIVFDNFNSENIMIPFSEVFDLDVLNNLLKEYDILVVDKTFIDYKINAIFYNQNNKIVDITDNLNIKVVTPPENVSQIFINYTINKKTISETYPRINVTTDINLYSYQHIESNFSKDTLFESLLKSIEFKPYLKKGKEYDNIIHIIDDYEKYKLSTSLEEYKNKLDETYIHLIKEFMKKEESILLIGRQDNVRVIDFLKENNYNYKVEILNNSFKEIEMLHSICNTFVGNFNLENLTGNPYSYYLSNKIKCKQKIMIDLYNL